MYTKEDHISKQHIKLYNQLNKMIQLLIWVVTLLTYIITGYTINLVALVILTLILLLTPKPKTKNEPRTI